MNSSYEAWVSGFENVKKVLSSIKGLKDGDSLTQSSLDSLKKRDVVYWNRKNKQKVESNTFIVWSCDQPQPEGMADGARLRYLNTAFIDVVTQSQPESAEIRDLVNKLETAFEADGWEFDFSQRVYDDRFTDRLTLSFQIKKRV